MSTFLMSIKNVFKRAVHAFASEKVFIVIVLLILFLYISGILFYVTVEKYKFIDAFYHCAMLITTVGNSDFKPQTAFGKVFTAIYSFLATGLFLGLVTGLAQVIIVQEHKKEKS